jgi:hypothetical protein
MEELDDKTKTNKSTISKISIFLLFLLILCYLPSAVKWVLLEIFDMLQNTGGMYLVIYGSPLVKLSMEGMLLAIPLSLIGLVFAIIAFIKEKSYRYRKLIFIASVFFFLFGFSNIIRMF